MRKKRGDDQEKEVNNERWLLTYSDLITLLMIFFVVMYSMSKLDVEKFKSMAESLNVVMGGGSQSSIIDGSGGPGIISPGSPGVDHGKDPDAGNGEGDGNAYQESLTLEGLKERLDKFSLDNGIQTQLISSIEERGLVISIQDTLLFDSGSADLTVRAQEILNKISTVLASAPNYIKVEGHTDNLPINTVRFPSNWELSVLRATNVVQIMQTTGGIKPERLSPTGYSEYRPIASNSTEEGRQRNRRVDLVILRSTYDLIEPGQQQAADALPGNSAAQNQ